MESDGPSAFIVFGGRMKTSPIVKALRLEWKVVYRLLLYLVLLTAVVRFVTFDGTCSTAWDSGKGSRPCGIFYAVILEPLLGTFLLLGYTYFLWIPIFLLATFVLTIWFKLSDEPLIP